MYSFYIIKLCLLQTSVFKGALLLNTLLSSGKLGSVKDFATPSDRPSAGVRQKRAAGARSESVWPESSHPVTFTITVCLETHTQDFNSLSALQHNQKTSISYDRAEI